MKHNALQMPKKQVSVASLRKKLFSAAAMLLVASIMLVSTSYAWLVLSTAPEITGVTTQVGANGALEIALLNTASYNDLTKVVEADIDESVEAAPALTQSNLSWGNLISLADAGYGLSSVTLNPSRLYITNNGSDDAGNTVYAINPLLLKTPIYNEDGRIVGLDKTKTVTSVYADEKWPVLSESQYGVRAIGLAANMSEAQMGVNTARATLANHMAEARTKTSNTLNTQGGALASIAVDYVSGADSFTAADAKALEDLATGLQNALKELESAVRQVYVGYIYTLGLSGDELTAAKTAVETAALTELKATYGAVSIPAAREGVTGDIIDLLVADQATVAQSILDCQALQTQSSISSDDIMDAMMPLVNYEKMMMGDKTIPELKEGGMDAIIEAVMANGVNLTVPTGSGILSDIADYAGNYTAKVYIDEISYGSYNLKNVDANMATVTSLSEVYLNQCSKLMLTFNTEGGGNETSQISDFFGYAIDLAFRTNTANSDLLLQSDPAQRVYDESVNAATQGGGSYMEFAPKAGLSASKMIKLMSGIRVVFMDQSMTVQAIAALDTELQRDDYVLAVNYGVNSSVTVGETSVSLSSENCTNYKATISQTEYEALAASTSPTTVDETTMYVLGRDAYTQKAADPEKYAMLKGVTSVQNSDYISQSAYNALTEVLEKDDYTVLDNPSDEQYAVRTSTIGDETPVYITRAVYDALLDTSAVTIDPATGKIKAKLYLYEFEMVESTAEHEDTTQTYYTGAIELGNKLESNAITALEENVPKQISAIVYLDGSKVNNSMVAAEGGYSMTGVLNLQFASSEMLTPMNNQALFDGEAEEDDDSNEAGNENGDNENENEETA